MRLRRALNLLILAFAFNALANSAPKGHSAAVNRHAGFDQSSDSHECGMSVAGILLCLHSAGNLELMLEVRNTGHQDEVLNLGIMLANGREQYPTAIKLTLTDAAGTKYQTSWGKQAVIGGRIDPLILPLASGSSLTIPIHLSRHVWVVSGQLQDFKPDPRQSYIAQAEFAGKPVGVAEANLDMKGVALMPYWTGVVSSNAVTIGPEPHGTRN